jgi:hypothetical protein
LNRAAQAVEHDLVDVVRAQAAEIDRLEVVPGRPLRLHTLGDCASDEAARIVAAAAARYRARGGGTRGVHKLSRVFRTERLQGDRISAPHGAHPLLHTPARRRRAGCTRAVVDRGT